MLMGNTQNGLNAVQGHGTNGHEHSAVADLFADPSVGATRLEMIGGAAVYEQKAPAENVYFINNGQVRIYQIGNDGESRLAEILGPGQWFGCAALSGQDAYAARAVAAVKTVLSAANATKLLEHVSRNPEAASVIIRNLAHRVQNARTDSARLVFDDCNSRLVQAMLRFSTSAAATTQGDAVVLHLTHEQLAQPSARRAKPSASRSPRCGTRTSCAPVEIV